MRRWYIDLNETTKKFLKFEWTKKGAPRDYIAGPLSEGAADDFLAKWTYDTFMARPAIFVDPPKKVRALVPGVKGTEKHDCWKHGVMYDYRKNPDPAATITRPPKGHKSGGLGHGWVCGICKALLQVG